MAEKSSKNHFEKGFFKQVNKSIFGKAKENILKHKVNKLVTTDKTWNYLLSEPNYYASKIFHRTFVDYRYEITHILMNKPVHLRLSILELSRTVMPEFWFKNVKAKHGE